MKLVAEELKLYPNIKLQWKEVGLSFQVQFVKLDFIREQELQQELQQEFLSPSLYNEILQKLSDVAMSRQDLSISLGQKKISGQLNTVLQKLIQDKLVERTIPDTPNHPSQKFRLTKRGGMFLSLLKKKDE